MEKSAEVQVRKDNGMTYFYVNVKIFQVTPYDYVIVHEDGSQRMINRMGILDIVLAPGSTGKIAEMPPAIGSA